MIKYRRFGALLLAAILSLSLIIPCFAENSYPGQSGNVTIVQPTTNPTPNTNGVTIVTPTQHVEVTPSPSPVPTSQTVNYANGNSRAVIGANLSDSQVSSVYGMFGISRGSVRELTVTNAEERQYLEGKVASSIIGTRSISCVYVEILPQGSGIQIKTQNVTWCTSQMYVNALTTAGITNAKIIVAAPFEVSGTAALTGVYKAYEDITGNKITASLKDISTQELTVTGYLAADIGDLWSTSIVNDMKMNLDITKNMSDSEIMNKISDIASNYNVTLNDSQLQQLLSLCRSFQKLDIDSLKSRVADMQETIKKVTDAKDDILNFFDKIKEIFRAIIEFFEKIREYFNF